MKTDEFQIKISLTYSVRLSSQT